MNKYNKINLKNVFKKIYSLNIADILVEAGGILFTELIKNKLVDEIHLFKSNIIIGKNGKPAILGKKFKNLRLTINEKKNFKEDKYYNYKVG